MSKQNDKEFLYHSLPDYILSKISDQDLISEIKSEIENNPDFKNEYDEMLGAFKFLDSARLDSPDEIYFSNLSVKINDRIYKEKITFNLFDWLGLKWKTLIPLSLIVIAAFLIFNLFIREKEEPAQNESSVLYNSNENIENKGKVYKVDSISQKNPISDPEILTKNKSDFTINESVTFKNSSKRKHNSNNDLNRITEVNDNQLLKVNKIDLGLLAYNIDGLDNQENELDPEEDILFFKDSDEDESDVEILKLTPEEEKEILEHL